MRCRTPGTIGRGLLAALVGLTLGAAEPSSDPPPLNFVVVAVDAHGQPVSDLSMADFEVEDAGKKQDIVWFHHNDEKLRPAPSLAPGELSNRSASDQPHATVILFDLLNERFSTRGISTNQLERQLVNMESAGDLYLYLLTLEGRLFAVRGLTSASVAEQNAGPPWTRQIKPILDGALNTVLRTRPVDIDDAVRVGLTLRALDTMSAQMSALPGRKNLIWLTDGIPIALGPVRSDTGLPVDFTPQLRMLSESFDRAETAIYPVAQIMLGSSDALGPTGGESSRATLDELAGLTGGRPTSSKDIGAAVKQALVDTRSSYQIGYYPPEQNWDSKFHKVRFTCKRKGVRLQARNGYYAWPEKKGERADRAFQTAAAQQFDASEIGLTGSLKPAADRPQHYKLSFRIDANDVVLARTGDHFDGELEFALLAWKKDGGVMSSSLSPLKLNYTAAERDQALRAGIPMSDELDLNDSVEKLRIVVFDRGSDTVGSLTLPLTHSNN